MTNIKCIVFDWGGVLIDDPAPGIVKYCSESLGVTAEAFIKARDKHLLDFDIGVTTEAVFWQQMAKDLKVSPPSPPTLWGDSFRQVYSPRPQVFAWAKALSHQGYTIGLLSNTEPPMVEYFEEQNYDMFDLTIFSCAVGSHKPDPAIYQAMLVETESPPSSVLYLDDKEPYVQAARDLDIESQQVKSAADIKQVLLDHSLLVK